MHSSDAFFGSETVVLKPGPCLDFRGAAAFSERCQAHVGAGKRYFVIDFSGTGILDSTGLGTLFKLHRQAGAAGGRVTFACPTKPVAMVFGLTKCDRVFGVYASVDEAVEKVAPGASGS